MFRIHSLFLFVVSLFVFLLLGCQNNPTIPAVSPETTVCDEPARTSSHQCFGYYMLMIDTETLKADPIPVRTAEWHFNLTGILNTTMGVSAAGVPSEHDPANGLFVFDITLTHPFDTSPQLAGFDVKGILMTPGTYAVGSLIFSGADETRLENADGYTRWWNPTEFTSPGMLGYDDGILASAPGSALTAIVNPYKLFADILYPTSSLASVAYEPLDSDQGRAVFTAGSSNTRRYEIRFPMDPGPQIVYGYAIDCAWNPPSPNPPGEVPDDFPMNANQPEAYRIGLRTTANTLYYDSESGVGGGVLRLEAGIFDWQGQAAGDIVPEIDVVRFLAPDLMPSGVDGILHEQTVDKAVYTVDLTGTAVPSEAGGTLVVCRVGSSDGSTYQQTAMPAPDAQLSAFQVLALDIPDPECAGDANNDFGEAAAIGLDEAVADQVCLPDDYRDYYIFEIPPVYAVSGSIDFYCDAEPTTIGIYKLNEELVYEESVSGGMASISMDEVTLFPRGYYMRIYTSNDTQVSLYYLDMNIELVDVTPYGPIEITPDELYCEPTNSFLHENYLIMIGYWGLWIYDITDTSDPDVIYYNPESFGGEFEYRWPYIYYAEYISSPSNYDVSLIDLSTITSPVVHHSVITVGYPIKDFAMNSEHLHMIYRDGDNCYLRIYDWMTNPLVPDQLHSGLVAISDFYYQGLALIKPEDVNTRLLFWCNNFIDMYDVEDPSLALYKDTKVFTGNIRDIKTWYSYFYVINDDPGTGTFSSCQVSSDVISIKGTESISIGSLCMDISGDYAYIGANDVIDVLDKSDINAPSLEASLPAESYVIHVDIEDDLMVATPVYTGFELYSLSYPQLPGLLYDSPVINDPMEIELFDNYALIADDDYNTYHILKVVDISDPANAHTVEEFPVSNSIMSMEYYDGTAYVGVGWDLVIFDCTDPLNLAVYDTIDLFENIGYFAVYRDTLYVGTWDDHIFVYDVTDPSSPVYKTTKDSTGAVMSMTFNGDYMYAVTNDYIVETFSISNAWNPTSQGTYTPGEEPSWVMTQDDFLYISCDSLFEILDISNPISPVYEGSVLGGPFDKYAHTAIDGLFAYVGGGWLHNCQPMICSLWPPDDPQNIYTFDPWTYSTPNDIEVQDGILYIATSKGLRIYELY